MAHDDSQGPWREAHKTCIFEVTGLTSREDFPLLFSTQSQMDYVQQQFRLDNGSASSVDFPLLSSTHSQGLCALASLFERQYEPTCSQYSGCGLTTKAVDTIIADNQHSFCYW